MAERLAIEGGRPAVRKLDLNAPKLGADELWALVEMWKIPAPAKARIRQILYSQKSVAGPYLFRYYGTEPSRVALAERLLARKIGTKRALAVNSCTSAPTASLRRPDALDANELGGCYPKRVAKSDQQVVRRYPQQERKVGQGDSLREIVEHEFPGKPCLFWAQAWHRAIRLCILFTGIPR